MTKNHLAAARALDLSKCSSSLLLLSSNNFTTSFLLFSKSFNLLSYCSLAYLLLACRSNKSLSNALYSLSIASWWFLSSRSLPLCL